VAGTGTSFAAPIETAHRVMAIEANRLAGQSMMLGAGIGARR
jgi:hypothetical protein